MAFEFGRNQEKVIVSVSTLGIIVGGLIMLSAMIGLLDTLFDRRGTVDLVFTLVLFQHVLRIFAGVYMILPLSSIQEVATSEGRDIDILVDGMSSIGTSFVKAAFLFGATILLDIVILFLR